MRPGIIAPQVSPDGTVSLRVTVPVKPLRAVTVTVDVVDWPALTGVGVDAKMLKSAAPDDNTFTATVALWASDPLVPLITTV